MSYVESPLQPLIVQDTPQSFVLQPSQAFNPGFYQLQLTGTLVQYPDVSASVLFAVEVADCNTILDDSGVQTTINA